MNTQESSVITAIVDLPAGNAGQSVILSNQAKIFIPRWNIDKWLKFGQKLVDLLKKLESYGMLGAAADPINTQTALKQLDQLIIEFLPNALEIVAGTIAVDQTSPILTNLPLSDLIEIIIVIINQELIANSNTN